LANGVRLALNNAAIPGWNEIDAVSINNIVQPVGILEQELANVEFKLYPNPSSGNFKINAASSFTDGTVLIFDITGKEVYRTFITDSNSKVTSELAPGVYFVKIQNDRFQSKTQKLIITN
jgi:hypothetical protein